MREYRLKIDPRAGISLLFILNFTIFNVSTVYALFVLLIWNCVYAMCNGYCRIAIKFIFTYWLLYLIEFLVFTETTKFNCYFLCYSINLYFKDVTSSIVWICFVKTTSLYELITALRKIHFPESIITGLSITLRYFPALREDFHKTYDAMKLKNMSVLEKISGLIITTMTRATLNIEELSQAASVRGIDNPVKKIFCG
ncbi:energy-coupling factor transporter transmembrane protein EcfT [Streptococcus equi subsp. equi]|uniref:energy-coupling factor transporter transmembrane component T n=1 Tax=Streptococcus equi TaxID=1336 RepID=UPI001E5F48F5|nr:energy-coupling factor transporter transmembrane component T [Streptococcus equi]MCD3499266.1 energy-coupling factor transporter transmembrane protein EcfT [Streptococcus equi subsp. equi]